MHLTPPYLSVASISYFSHQINVPNENTTFNQSGVSMLLFDVPVINTSPNYHSDNLSMQYDTIRTSSLTFNW